MCTFDTHKKVWKTVTKAHSGLDDSTIEHLQIELKPLMQKCDGKNLPKWLKCNSAMIPDFIARNPDAMPVWEIAGAEFTKADGHTADGISIRFPRVTRRRSDKQPAQATNLEELKHLCDESKKHINLNLLDKMRTKDECSTSKPRVEDKNTKPESSRSKQPTIMDALKPKDSRLSVKRKNSDEPLIAVKREKIEIVAVETEKLGLFSHIVMFIPEVLSGNTLKSEIGEFKREGGRVTKLSIEATHVLHDSSLIESDLSQLRYLS